MALIEMDFMNGGDSARTDVEYLYCGYISSGTYLTGLYNFSDMTAEQWSGGYSAITSVTLKNKVTFAITGSHQVSVTAINDHYLYEFHQNSASGNYWVSLGKNATTGNMGSYYANLRQFIVTDEPLDIDFTITQK